MRPHFRLSTSDKVILLGAMLLVISFAGLLIDSALANAPDEDERNVVVRVAAPTQAGAQVQPTWTPFQPQAPTPAAAVPETGGAQIAIGDITPPPAGERAVFLVPVNPEATATPEAAPLTPDRIVIPSIQVDAPVVPSGYRLLDYYGQVYQQWEAPTDYAAGWQLSSPGIGVPGNTVLNGHHNVYGSVFGRLADLPEGDMIQIYSGGTLIQYEIANKMILPEEGQSLDVRLDNARWLQPTDDERLTLVTCWPPNGNSHRLIIVARPVARIGPS